MANSKYYIDFSDSIRNLSKEVKNVKSYRNNIPKKDDITKKFDSLEFLQKIEFFDYYLIEKEDQKLKTVTAKYIDESYNGFKFEGKKTVEKVNKLSDFSRFISSLEEELDGIKNASSNLNTLIVSSPNFFIIFFAIDGPSPFIFPFAKYFSNAPNVSGISFSNVSTLNCLP